MLFSTFDNCMIDKYQITPEQKFVFALSSNILDMAQIESIKTLLNSGLNWKQVCEFSIAQGVASHVYNSIQKLNNELHFGAANFDMLKPLFYANSSHNVYLLHELKKLIQRIAETEIEFALIKGFALQSSIYDTIAIRQMGDFDFFILQKNAWKLFDFLKKQGFAQSDEFISNWHQKHFSEIGKHLPDLTNGVYKIDILPELIRNNEPFNKAAWDNLISKDLDGVNIRTLSPDFNLHYLCYHLEQHYTEDGIHLGLYCDIAEVIKKYSQEIDWDKFVGDIEKFKVSANQYRHILITEQFLFVCLPPILKKFLEQFNLQHVINEFFEALEKPLKTSDAKHHHYKLNMVKQIKGFKNKISFLSGELFPQKEFMKKRYKIKNEKLIYLHYPVRIAASIGKAIKVLLGK